MSAVNKIYVGQSNLRLWVSTGADITNYTSTTLEVYKPSGSTTTWTCTVNDASTGSMYYDFDTTGTLDVAGIYKMQAKVIYTTDSVSYGKTTQIRVYPLFG